MTTQKSKYILCFDDSGSRDPDRVATATLIRDDKMDWFALGGFLVKEEDVKTVVRQHQLFLQKWNIDYDLHSTKIRGHHGKFAWLNKKENSKLFYPALGQFLVSLPIICIACVIHRPGYVIRYREKYNDRLWFMCRTTFSILVERAAKYVDKQGGQLEIIFEGSGKKEDSDIIQYLRTLKSTGNPFNPSTSQDYRPFTAEDYARVIIGEPRRKTKANPLLQIADLILYPIAKSGYNSEYPPYKELRKHNKIIDCVILPEDKPFMSVKYSCFDGEDIKAKARQNRAFE